MFPIKHGIDNVTRRVFDERIINGDRPADRASQLICEWNSNPKQPLMASARQFKRPISGHHDPAYPKMSAGLIQTRRRRKAKRACPDAIERVRSIPRRRSLRGTRTMSPANQQRENSDRDNQHVHARQELPKLTTVWHTADASGTANMSVPRRRACWMATSRLLRPPRAKLTCDTAGNAMASVRSNGANRITSVSTPLSDEDRLAPSHASAADASHVHNSKSIER